MRAVAEAVLERLQDEIALDVGDGAADKRARHRFRRHRGVGNSRRVLGLIEAHAVGRDDAVDADLVADRQQHGAVQRVFQFTHVAWPAVEHQRAPRLGR